AEEGDAVIRTLAREQLGVGEARVVVDCQVQVLPACLTRAVQAIAEDCLPDRPEAAEPLDVDMEELARPCALVALDRLAGRHPQARAAVTAQHLPDGRSRPSEQSANDQRPRLRILTRLEDLGLGARRKPPRLTARHRRPIEECRPTTLLIATPEPV